MSETYPKKDPLRNAFRRTYFPPRRIRLQSYYIFFILASTYTKKSPFMSENINGGKGMKVE